MINDKPKALVFVSARVWDEAAEELWDAGFYEAETPGSRGGPCYTTTRVRVNALMLPGIRSASDDREVLGDIAKQLVIAGVAFRVVTAR